ncbi:hypothetical protein N431DRAFT_426677 [Stipitochalara longipes BDJ]|nr:hypothetical protein N431DRAFT_426677 [Stipitochalara longipes BDJ]
MSFGASSSDVVIVVAFCRALHRKCRDAGWEYDEIRDEVRGLHTVLKHLKNEVEAPESPLRRDRAIWGQQLESIVGDCDFTLKQLDALLQKYERLSSGGGSARRVKLGSNEMDTLGSIRVKLISHQTSLTSFLDRIQLRQSGEAAPTLDNQDGQLDVILDKVDAIAARMGQRSGSILAGHDDDDKEVWKQFRQELIKEGFSSDVLAHHKDVLRAYIRQIDQEGLLDEMPPRLLVPAQQPGFPQHLPSKGPPPTFDSLNTPTDDGSAKEMVVREENMKFPQSMKFERRKPETRHIDLHTQLDSINISKDIIPRTTPAVPKLITSDEKEVQYYNTDGSSDEDSESEASSKGRHLSLVRSNTPPIGVVVFTSDLFKSLNSNQGLKLMLPGSPSSFRSSQGSFGEEDSMRALATRPKNPTEFGSSPARPGAIPIPAASPRTSSEGFGTSPGPETIRLAPDEHGNEIPPNAHWTKINRRLVSPTVLDQDHRRYEARPEWVAVLGVLTRAEIESYAARTAELRRRRNQAAFPKETPPPQPPRPAQIPRTNSHLHTGRDTPSTTDSESSDSTHHRQRSRNRPGRSYTPSDINVPVSGYPNPFGQPIPIKESNRGPPSPNWSPSNSMSHGVWMASPPKNLSAGGIWVPAQGQQGGVFYPPKEKERERQRSSRRHYSHESHSKSSHSGRDRDRDRSRNSEKKAPPPQKVSRWKENLTAASIGGAAVSLLNVLSEAAEGL